MTVALTSRYDEAVKYAREAHGTQTRKGTSIPYVAHLLGVSSLVLDAGGDEDEAIGGLLHDIAEDCGGRPRLEDVRGRFGDKVARIVEGCTDSWTTPKEPWTDRKRNYVEHARHLPPEVLRVSAADKVHNTWAILRDLRAQGDSVWERFNATPDDVLWYYQSLVRAFRQSGGGPLVDELERVVRALQREMGY